MNVYRSRIVHVTLRETLLLLIAAVASLLFYAHEYFRGTLVSLIGIPLDRFVLLTVIVYVLIRAVLIVDAIRAPKIVAQLEICPECGQPLDDGTPKGRGSHERITLTPRPTEKEILAAVALRKAIDDARMAARVRREARGTLAGLPGRIENPPVGFERLAIPPDITVTPRIVQDPRKPKGPA